MAILTELHNKLMSAMDYLLNGSSTADVEVKLDDVNSKLSDIDSNTDGLETLINDSNIKLDNISSYTNDTQSKLDDVNINLVSANQSLDDIETVLEDVHDDANNAIRVIDAYKPHYITKTTVTTSGSIASGYSSVSMLTSNDFIGTILGDISTSNTGYTFNTYGLPAIPYTITQGNIQIITITDAT